MSLRAARWLIMGLAAGCAVLAIALLIQLAGFGRGYGWLADEAGVAPLDVGTIDRTPFSLPPESTFSAAAARPLFNDDRQPTPLEALAEAGPATPPVPLNITLTGVIITSKVRLAMIQDKSRNQPLALKVGMPLDGEQSQWTLVEVNARSAVFLNPANERSEVALETSAVPLPAVADAPAIQQPAPPRAATKPGQPIPAGQRTGQPGESPAPLAEQGAANANEDLVKRIEERRRQMREEAEKLRQQPNAANNSAAPATDKKE
ncbi:MAG: hypothetical protein ABIP56_07595 [Dokdonella sp.]